MEKNSLVKNIIKASTKLQTLCEGFDIDSKNAIITTKFKVLFFVSEGKNVSPSDLINKIGIAKSNLALLCKKMISENLLESKRDSLDSRVIFYSITKEGKTLLDETLETMTKNFKGQLAYKNMFREIEKLLVGLNEIID